MKTLLICIFSTLLFTAFACDDDKSSNNNANNINNTNNVTNNATCGDGVVSGAEVCDGADLAGETCTTRGFTGGTLSCAATCLSFVTSACTNNTNPVCGNGAQENGEECDGTDFGTATCVSLGFTGGTLACTMGCTFDTSACENGGGDGLVGDACGSAADCGGISGADLTAECVTDPTGMGLFTLPGGYCSSTCVAPANPGDADACTAVGGTCVNVIMAAYCLKPCTDASECREPDYGCSAVPGGVETDLYCLPPMGK